MGIHLRGRLSDSAARRKETVYKDRISSRVKPEEIKVMQDRLALLVRNKQTEVAQHGNGQLTEHHYRDVLEEAHSDPVLSELLNRAGLRSVSTWSLFPNHLAEIKIKTLLEDGIIPQPPDHEAGDSLGKSSLFSANRVESKATPPTSPRISFALKKLRSLTVEGKPLLSNLRSIAAEFALRDKDFDSYFLEKQGEYRSQLEEKCQESGEPLGQYLRNNYERGSLGPEDYNIMIYFFLEKNNDLRKELFELGLNDEDIAGKITSLIPVENFAERYNLATLNSLLMAVPS